MTDILNSLIGSHIHNFLHSKQPLAAIWIDKPIQTEPERTRRLCKGQRIRVINGEITDVDKDHPATHVIVDCFGTHCSDFEIEIEDLINHKKSKLSV
jgi:hypothetical protein